jgi:hypothetical protein
MFKSPIGGCKLISYLQYNKKFGFSVFCIFYNITVIKADHFYDY